MFLSALTVWPACALFAASVVCDLSRRRVPNAIPLALLGLFVAYALTGAAGPPQTLWGHFAIGLALLAFGFVLYLGGQFGGGDGKLLAVAGLWAGPAGLSVFLFALAGCAFALVAFALLPFEATRRIRRELPFALAIAPPAVAVMIPRTLSA